MNTKLLFFDIDGTILSHRTDQISDSTKEAIKKAQANGHLAFINTGRTIAELDRRMLDFGFDGFICGCGTYITYKNKILLRKSISPELLPALITDLHKYKMEAILEGSNAVYYDDASTHRRIINLKEHQRKHNFNIKSFEDPGMSVDKFCIWSDSPENYQSFYNIYKDQLDFIDRMRGLYEVVLKGYSKASGIEFLLNHLGITHDNTYAFGDSSNDLSMLLYAKNSIAMGNSSKDIKDIVTYVTDDVDENGIENALKHFGLI